MQRFVCIPILYIILSELRTGVKFCEFLEISYVFVKNALAFCSTQYVKQPSKAFLYQQYTLVQKVLRGAKSKICKLSIVTFLPSDDADKAMS